MTPDLSRLRKNWGELFPQPPRGRWVLSILLVLSLTTGLWQMEKGLWIYGKARLAQALLHQAWTRALAGEREPRPWPWAETWPIARLRQHRLGIDLIVLANAAGHALAFGPAHVAHTAMPGRRGTTVITGHRDTHFTFLHRLRPGDLLWIDTPDGRTVGYVMREAAVADSRTGVLVSDHDSRLALVTCYPFDAMAPGGPWRFVVMAEQWPGRRMD